MVVEQHPRARRRSAGHGHRPALPVALLAAAPLAHAQAPDLAAGPPEEEEEARRLERPTERVDQIGAGRADWLLLDWGGARSWMEERGVTAELLLTNDLSWAAAGGRHPGAGASRVLAELSLLADSAALFGYEGGLFHAGFEGIAGENGSAEIGTVQELSSIDADGDRAQLARVWYEHRWSAVFARAGKIDANSLFAYVDGGAHFLHSSMGVSPTILGLPTYPDPAFGLAVGAPLGSDVELRLGVFDGAAQEGVPTGSHGPSTLFGEPSDLFLIAELGARWRGELPGRAGVGAWQHTGTFDRFDGGREDGSQGVYLVADQRLARGAADGERALDAFLQLGWADRDVSAVEAYLGAGLVWRRPFLPRRLDELGLGVAAARLSDEPGAGFTEGEEVAVEAYWGVEPRPWLRFKPALQYVVHPGGDASLDDALVLTLRTTLSL